MNPLIQDLCQNCNTPLLGRWCHACGQRRIDPEQRTLRWLLGQFAGALSDLDSRFLRSVRALLFEPGRLGAEWLAGRRAAWSSPIALFLLVNVVYFFVPVLNDLNLPLADQTMQWYGAHARALIDARLAERGIPFATYAAAFLAESGNLAKSLIILHVPPFAVLQMLLSGRRDIAFADHFSIALHIWTVFLVALLVIPALVTGAVGVTQWFGLPVEDAIWHRVLQWSLFGSYVLYIFGTMRRAYGATRLHACVVAPLLFGAGMAAHFGYRAVLFYLAFALT